MGQVRSSTGGRVATSIAGGIIAAPPPAYLVGKIVEKWGVLDPLADQIGGWLKVHVPPSACCRRWRTSRVGRRESDGLYVLIDPSFWESNTLSRPELLNVMGSGRTEPIDESGTDDQFQGIMVNRSEVERVWPHEG